MNARQEMRKGFAPTVDFSEFCMSEARIIGPAFIMPSQKTVCTVLQAVSLSTGHRRENQPHFSHRHMLLLAWKARSRADLLHG